MIKIQKEYVKTARENLAIARVREKRGDCGMEEVMRWATQLNVNEQKLLEMRAEYKNLRIMINKMLNKPQKEDYELAPLLASDPAFYTSEINIIDYVIYNICKNIETEYAIVLLTMLLRRRLLKHLHR